MAKALASFFSNLKKPRIKIRLYWTMLGYSALTAADTYKYSSETLFPGGCLRNTEEKRNLGGVR